MPKVLVRAKVPVGLVENNKRVNYGIGKEFEMEKEDADQAVEAKAVELVVQENKNTPPAGGVSAEFVQLKARAKELGIPGYTKMSKIDLQEAITEKEKSIADDEAAVIAEAEELAALKEQAAALEIEGYEELTKEQLVDAITEATKE